MPVPRHDFRTIALADCVHVRGDFDRPTLTRPGMPVLNQSISEIDRECQPGSAVHADGTSVREGQWMGVVRWVIAVADRVAVAAHAARDRRDNEL